MADIFVGSAKGGIKVGYYLNLSTYSQKTIRRKLFKYSPDRGVIRWFLCAPYVVRHTRIYAALIERRCYQDMINSQAALWLVIESL